MLFLTDVDHVSFEKANETRQNNLQSATVSLQVVIGLCKRKETAALKSKPPFHKARENMSAVRRLFFFCPRAADIHIHYFENIVSKLYRFSMSKSRTFSARFTHVLFFYVRYTVRVPRKERIIMSILLQVKNITKIYPNQPKPGLDNISFEVAQGEFLGIMGASGSGKTTLLNVLSTIDVPTNGHIVMGKTHIEKLGQRQAADFRKNNLGFIFQEYFLLDSLTVRENIAVPLTLLHKPAQEIDRKVKELAELFGIDSQLKKYPSELSGGQRQRVAAARAMVKRPPLIFADEPTGALDSGSATELLTALKEVNHTLGTTILMVTHDPYAASYTDRILYFKDGHIISELQRHNSERRCFYEAIMQESARQDEKR